MALTRLDKMLSDSGVYTRSEAKALIRAGRVAVDGSAVRSPEARFDASACRVTVDGSAVNCSAVRTFLLNKPAGVLSATEDPSQQTVIDLLPQHLRRIGLFPVGRLDKDTTGLLLLTNDGAYAHSITSPVRHVPKTYYAEVDAPLGNPDAEAFAAGIVLGDGTVCAPARLQLLTASSALVTITEGKYHQVKRMFASRGAHVTALSRRSIGALFLPESLRPGDYTELSDAERALALAFPGDAAGFFPQHA